mmetsp:Transcript_5615/g.11411  ORF Transcript_5615/g.11411 Transcript_5615/m.11411 type:complete len:219 (+) Transcript_5615:67-723(+)
MTETDLLTIAPSADEVLSLLGSGTEDRPRRQLPTARSQWQQHLQHPDAAHRDRAIFLRVGIGLAGVVAIVLCLGWGWRRPDNIRSVGQTNLDGSAPSPILQRFPLRRRPLPTKPVMSVQHHAGPVGGAYMPRSPTLGSAAVTPTQSGTSAGDLPWPRSPPRASFAHGSKPLFGRQQHGGDSPDDEVADTGVPRAPSRHSFMSGSKPFLGTTSVMAPGP